MLWNNNNSKLNEFLLFKLIYIKISLIYDLFKINYYNTVNLKLISIYVFDCVKYCLFVIV